MKQGRRFIAYTPALDIATSASTERKVRASFSELVIIFMEELHEKGIDPCGENGEFHTLVINCPLFSGAIELPEFTRITYENYCFIVWE